MYWKCYLINKKVKIVCKALGYILGIFLVLCFDAPFYLFHSGQIHLAPVKAGNIINEKIPDKLEETQAQSLMKYAGDPHSDEKAFVIKKSDFSPPNKGDYREIKVVAGHLDSSSEYTYEKKEHDDEEYDAEEYVNDQKEDDKYSESPEDEESKKSFLKPNPSLAKLRYFFSIYNYVRGLIPANDKEHEGWRKNVSRRTLDYLNPTADTARSYIPKSYCSQKKPFILIIICSNPKNLVPRQAIRQTWGYAAPEYNIAIFFLVGKSSESSINEKAKQENNLHRDLIIENFRDSYNNLTLKSILMLKWVEKYCNQVPFVMKADDDIYVNLENLNKYTINAQKKNDSRKFLVGRIVSNASPYRDPKHKWYVPFYMYPWDYFPNYTHGVAYMMSKKVAAKLYKQSLKMKFIHLEDVFITGICAKAAKLTPIDQKEFHFHTNANIACGSPNFTKLIILAHHVSPIQMYRLHWEALRCSAIRI